MSLQCVHYVQCCIFVTFRWGFWWWSELDVEFFSRGGGWCMWYKCWNDDISDKSAKVIQQFRIGRNSHSTCKMWWLREITASPRRVVFFCHSKSLRAWKTRFFSNFFLIFNNFIFLDLILINNWGSYLNKLWSPKVKDVKSL